MEALIQWIKDNPEVSAMIAGLLLDWLRRMVKGRDLQALIDALTLAIESGRPKPAMRGAEKRLSGSAKKTLAASVKSAERHYKPINTLTL